MVRMCRLGIPLLALLAALAAAPAMATTPDCPHVQRAERVVEGRIDPSVPLTIVAFGSSSTEGAGASSPEHSYPARLEALLRAALPGRSIRVVNAGRSGQTSTEMLARLDQDVLARHPALVIWQAGGNEALKGGDPTVFEQAMRDGLAKLKAAGIPVVLLDNQRSPAMARAHATRFDAVMAQLAQPEGIGIFRRGAWQATAPDPAALVSPDGLHLNDAGYACLATALADVLLPALRPQGPAMATARR